MFDKIKKRDHELKVAVYVSTYEKLEGRKPTLMEMYKALGSEYKAAIADFLRRSTDPATVTA